MNMALHFCWKEWRAQRGLLTAYSLLVLACLCLGFLLAPEHFWQQDGNRAHVLGWFVGAGVLGVLMFATPQLVRGEHTGNDDLFVRRLPGALLPAFSGKLLFLLLAALALPLLGLCAGELFLQATGHLWDDLFWAPTTKGVVEVRVLWPAILVYAGLAMVLVPWVWVMAMWLPGGRMAIGGVALLVLLLGVSVFAVLRPCPGLEQTLGGWNWLWSVSPFGFLVGGLSWVRGRRGGGSARSARIGLATLGVGLLPPGVWLGTQVHDYHHPDLDHLVELRVDGLSPDLRYALARGTSHAEWATVPLRIDLQAGTAEQIGSIYTVLDDAVLRPFAPTWGFAQQRYWQWVQVDPVAHGLFDLVTGELRPAEYDPKAQQVVLSPELAAVVEVQVRKGTRLQAPGGVRSYVVGGAMTCEFPNGDILRTAWPGEWRRGGMIPCGHGIHVLGSKDQHYDLTRGRFVELPGRADAMALAVGGRWLVEAQHRESGQWLRFDPDSESKATPLPELKDCRLLGLLDDERVLCVRYDRLGTRASCVGEVFAYCVADRSVTPLPLPQELAGLVQGIRSALPLGSLLGRDPRGRVWVACGLKGEPRSFAVLTIDPVTLRVGQPLRAVQPKSVQWSTIQAFVDDRTLLVVDGIQIVRIDTDTGQRTVLFPRAEVAK